MKFRFDNDWSNDLGLNNDDKSIAINGYSFPIPEDGAYDIVLDMTHKMKPQYSIKKSVQ